jgi:hypothetical protein
MQEEAKTLRELLAQCEALCSVAKTASKHRKSLAGDNFYGTKFHRSLVALGKLEPKVKTIAGNAGVGEEALSDLASCLLSLKATDTKTTKRSESLKKLTVIIETIILPAVESSTAPRLATHEHVLPSAVVQRTRGYLERIVQQANGCYEQGWYDACSVMIRKLVEILIIEVYEAANRASFIQDSKGEFFMLSDLISRISGDTAINLGREAKQALPQLKALGDRSAHNRRYIATKADVDKVLAGLRVVTDELLHLSKLK